MKFQKFTSKPLWEGERRLDAMGGVLWAREGEGGRKSHFPTPFLSSQRCCLADSPAATTHNFRRRVAQSEAPRPWKVGVASSGSELAIQLARTPMATDTSMPSPKSPRAGLKRRMPSATGPIDWHAEGTTVTSIYDLELAARASVGRDSRREVRRPPARGARVARRAPLVLVERRASKFGRHSRHVQEIDLVLKHPRTQQTRPAAHPVHNAPNHAGRRALRRPRPRRAKVFERWRSGRAARARTSHCRGDAAAAALRPRLSIGGNRRGGSALSGRTQTRPGPVPSAPNARVPPHPRTNPTPVPRHQNPRIPRPPTGPRSLLVARAQRLGPRASLASEKTTTEPALARVHGPRAPEPRGARGLRASGPVGRPRRRDARGRARWARRAEGGRRLGARCRPRGAGVRALPNQPGRGRRRFVHL